MKIGKYFLMTLVSLILVLTSCAINMQVPPSEQEEMIAEQEEITQYYDDPIQGWYIPGYWTGGCINCGNWIYPFWTTDIIVLNNHWVYYHGAHRQILEREGRRHRLAQIHKQHRDKHQGKSLSPQQKKRLEKDQPPKQQIEKQPPKLSPPPQKQPPPKKQEKKQDRIKKKDE